MNTDNLIEQLDLDYIHNSALAILEQIGFELPDEKTRDKIRSVKGIKIKGDRVMVSPELAESIVTDMRAKPFPPKNPQWRFGGGGACHWLLKEIRQIIKKNNPDGIIAYLFDAPTGPVVTIAATGTKGSAKLTIDKDLFGKSQGQGTLYRLNGNIEEPAGRNKLSIELDTNEVAVWIP
ncbi:MAG: hypothetical protein ABIG61_08140 [Planctomycetota bacterium]